MVTHLSPRQWASSAGLLPAVILDMGPGQSAAFVRMTGTAETLERGLNSMAASDRYFVKSPSPQKSQ
jgi:hypothetical protein